MMMACILQVHGCYRFAHIVLVCVVYTHIQYTGTCLLYSKDGHHILMRHCVPQHRPPCVLIFVFAVSYIDANNLAGDTAYVFQHPHHIMPTLNWLCSRWQCSVTAQKHSRHLNRQANCLHVRQLQSLLLSTFTCWVSHLQVQKHSRQNAKRAQHGICQFKLRQALISWYRCTQTAKIAHLHRQLEASNSLHGHLKQQCGDAEQAVAELQEERAGLHRRLERVADHAKLQVAHVI